LPIHVVEQGEHLSSIAEKYGFLDFQTIWNDAENAALRDKRKNPHVLMPGDKVFIPDMKLKNEARSTGAKHTFKIKPDQLKLKVLIEDVDGEPIEDEVVGVLIEGTASREKLPGGLLEKDIKRTDHTGKIELRDDQIPMAIGDLDPVSEESGQLARLLNLGYYRRSLEPVDEDERQSAIEEFQCDQEIRPVTGVCDAKTQATLLDAHGC
jgi:hypothetical protein